MSGLKVTPIFPCGCNLRCIDPKAHKLILFLFHPHLLPPPPFSVLRSLQFLPQLNFFTHFQLIRATTQLNLYTHFQLRKAIDVDILFSLNLNLKLISISVSRLFNLEGNQLTLNLVDPLRSIQKMRRPFCLKNPIAFVGVVVCISCLTIIMISVLRLPEVSSGNKVMITSENEEFGVFGEMMLEMLPDDLPFTVFIPSDEAFARDLKLQVKSSLAAEKINDTYAIVSQILGFSAIPRSLFSSMVSSNKGVRAGVSYDTLSGFILYVSKDVDGMLIVNRIRSKRVDVRRKEIVVHIMNGVVMDAEFELSIQSDEEG